ncbi:unnamed protein product [Durusdinium trenchii]|uniref:Pentatricopeptide repeat-containing protein, chloroplastic n=1 Tax=Durusdinium trenchii TaxID=1381693 RepID=A0ABP0HVV8_9DINO
MAGHGSKRCKERATRASEFGCRKLQTSRWHLTRRLTALSRQRCWQKALAELQAFGFTNVFHINAAMLGLKSAEWPKALQLLLLLQVAGRQPDAVSLSSVLATQTWDLAARTFQKLQSNLVKTDERCFNSALLALRASPVWLRSVHFLEEMMQSQVVRSAVAESTVISGLPWRLCFAWLLSGQVIADRITWNAAISLSAKCLAWQAALQLFQAMHCFSLQQESASFLSLVAPKTPAWAAALATTDALLIAEDSRHKGRQLLAGAISAKLQWRAAIEFLRRYSRVSVKMDHISWSSTLCNAWCQALSALKTMKLVNLPIDQVTRRSVVISLERALCWPHALMLQHGDVTLKAGPWQQAGPGSITSREHCSTTCFSPGIAGSMETWPTAAVTDVSPSFATEAGCCTGAMANYALASEVSLRFCRYSWDQCIDHSSWPSSLLGSCVGFAPAHGGGNNGSSSSRSHQL